LAGDPDLGFEVTVKENDCKFNLDFSKVYWNPRLSTEHDRIVNIVERGDIVFDVFAGIGPFSLPIAKKGKITKKESKGIIVHANDLNPSSYEYLQKNVQLNKICIENFHCYNLDGAQFIEQIVSKELEKCLECSGNIHILMNLPAMAMTFLPSFKNLLKPEICHKWAQMKRKVPLVHVYAFNKMVDINDISVDAKEELAKEACAQLKVDKIEDLKVHYVRNVAPYKDMYRVTFPLTIEIMMMEEEVTNEPDNKKLKIQAENT